jgi:lysophospholipase L1-like esterase
MSVDRRWVYAGLVVAAAGAGLAKLLPSGPRIRPDTRLMLVGDSLAVGMAPYFSCLSKEQKLPFDALAKVSTRIDQWAASQVLTDHVATFQPTLVLVSLGTNDAFMMGDVATKQRPALAQLIAKLSAGGAEIAWIGPPQLPGKPNAGLLALLKSAFPTANYFASETLPIPRGPDGLHPTAKGYAGWSGALWQWLSGPPGSGSCGA